MNLIKMVGMRNILAHAYENVDLKIIFEVLHKHYIDVEKLIKIIEKLR